MLLPVRRIFLVACIAALFAAFGVWARHVVRDTPERLPVWLQQRPSIYLNVALKSIHDKAIAPPAVDWPALASRAREAAQTARTPAETYPAIRDVLAQIGEDAGTLLPPQPADTSGGAYGMQVFFPERIIATVFPQSAADAAGIRPGDVIELVDGQTPAASTDPRSRGRLVQIPRPKAVLRVRRGGGTQVADIELAIGSWQPLPAGTGRIGGDIGLVALPATAGDGDFTQRVRDAIHETDAPAVCGWIVDLRRNNGGALWPTLNAVQAILGAETAGFFSLADGGRLRWDYPATGAAAIEHPVTPLARSDAATAILTSRLTSNAGEHASIAFRGKPHTRVFGEPTWGASALQTTKIKLPDGATIELSAARAADRTGRVYEGRIAPDEPAPIDWTRVGTPDDPTVAAAAKWLRLQPACKTST